MEMPRRPVRVSARDWRDFCAQHSGGGPDALREFIAWSLRRPGAELPAQLPDVPQQLVPDDAMAQFTAWYLRRPDAKLPARPDGAMPTVLVRVPDPDWQDFGKLYARAASGRIREFIAWSLHRPGAVAPVRHPLPG
jgi:hypothetical protein